MRVFAIGDTHLSRARPKPMDIFGEQWKDHDEQIRRNWNAAGADDDLLLIAGDVSWAMHLEEAQADLEYLAMLRGTKLLLKGNHDYWWGAISRVRASAPKGIDFLQNDAHLYDGVAVVGARGWVLPDSPCAGAEDARIYEREVERLRLSIAALGQSTGRRVIAMTHYPPLRRLDEGTPMSDAIESSGARVCVYGHLHGADIETAPQGMRNGVRYKLVSADAVAFTPWQICESCEPR
ncbi:MAG TPA: metallophosphoesterase [Bryobacteraceae bacterium]|nr:metallophosphoesterase [Bryobacteraceae bacterium]